MGCKMETDYLRQQTGWEQWMERMEGWRDGGEGQSFDKHMDLSCVIPGISFNSSFLASNYVPLKENSK